MAPRGGWHSQRLPDAAAPKAASPCSVAGCGASATHLVDLDHGRRFAPTCRGHLAQVQEQVARARAALLDDVARVKRRLQMRRKR